MSSWPLIKVIKEYFPKTAYTTAYDWFKRGDLQGLYHIGAKRKKACLVDMSQFIPHYEELVRSGPIDIDFEEIEEIVNGEQTDIDVKEIAKKIVDDF